MDIERRLSKAKTALVLEHPFVGSIALNLPFILTDQIPTAAVDGKRVAFNPDFVDSLSDEELKFLIAHECFHPMLEHNFRRNGRDPKRWNQACDYVINKLITDEGIGRMPEGGLLSEDIYQAGGGTSDGIFKILAENSGGWRTKQNGNGHGDPLDDCEDASGDPAEQAQQEAEWKVKVAQAAQAAKMMGKLSAGMERFVDTILKPKVDWRDVMQRFLVKVRNAERTFSRPNRRFVSQGLYLPSVTGETMGDVVFGVDCSGSIDQDEINQYAAEIRTVHEDLSPRTLHVVYFDSSVSHYDKFEPDDTVEVKPHGGGGTAFSPVFKFIDEQGIDPVACVILTDLCCSDFGSAPSYPVLWVSTYSENAPFGDVVMM
jgi:predicted metal-dependent peptidase